MPRDRIGRLGKESAGRRQALSLATALAAAALLASCGLETVVIYESPGFTDDAGRLTLSHDAANESDPSFLGYEIYYRAYDSSEAADTDRKAIEAAIDQDSATPDSCMSKLESLKFRRMTNAVGSDERPRFRTSIFIADKLAIFYGASGWDIADVAPDEDDIKRWTSQSFNSTYYPDDEDYAGSSTLVSPNPAYFVFFAVAYGFDIVSGFKEVHSYPKGTGNVVEIPLG